MTGGVGEPCSHLRIDDPLEVFFSLLRTTRASLDPPEQARVPLHTFLSPFSGLIALHVLDLGLLVGSELMVPLPDGLRGLLPELLRFSLLLFLYRSDPGL